MHEWVLPPLLVELINIAVALCHLRLVPLVVLLDGKVDFGRPRRKLIQGLFNRLMTLLLVSLLLADNQCLVKGSLGIHSHLVLQGRLGRLEW